MKEILHALAGVSLGAYLVLSPLSALADHSTPSSIADIPPTAIAETKCSLQSDLSLGMSGSAVTCLQERLIQEGVLSSSLKTGYFGDMTKSALMRWQTKHGIASTGYFGAISRSVFSGAIAHPYYQELEDSHKAMMAAFMNPSSTPMSMNMRDDRKTIAVVLYDEFEPLDAIGPLEVLGQLRGYKVVTVAKQKGAIASALGTKIVADYSFDELKNPAIVVVPGGLFGTIAASKDPRTLAWLREADKTSEYTTSVCTGAWILGAAGLLNGRQASTHWTGAEYLEDFGVQYSGKRYTVDGKYVTGAGVSAGIDMSFKLVAMLEGEDAAIVAQLGLEYDPQPPFDAGSPAKSDPQLVKIMRDMMTDHVMAANMMYGPASSSTTVMTMSESHEHSHADSTSSTMDMHAHKALDVSSWSAVPAVSIQMHPDTMGGWNLEISTQNFRFAPEHVGGSVVAGEGHAHLYIDGVKVGRVYGNWYNVPTSLFKGAGSHEVRVTLNANDHSDLESKGTIIEAKTTVETHQ